MLNHLRTHSRSRCPGGNRRRRPGGFTLIEVLVSLFILSIMAVCAVNLFSATMASDNKAHRKALASALLQNEVEYIRTMSGISTTDTHYSPLPTSTTVGNVTTITGIVTSSQGTIMPNCKIVMTEIINTTAGTPYETYSMKQITGALYWNMGATQQMPIAPTAVCYTMFAIEQKHVGG